jgi:hypothetical protein
MLICNHRVSNIILIHFFRALLVFWLSSPGEHKSFPHVRCVNVVVREFRMSALSPYYRSGANGTSATPTPPASSPVPSINGPPSTRKKSALVPTNHVTTKEGLTVRARIEPSLTVEDVIRQLCINLKIKDPPVMFALRDEDDELVTTDNLKKKIKARSNLK